MVETEELTVINDYWYRYNINKNAFDSNANHPRKSISP